MRRSAAPEIMDAANVPAGVLRRFHRDLRLVHRLTGTMKPLLERLAGAESVLDIGCGDGALLAEIGKRTGAAVTGVDLKRQPVALVHMIQANAACDPLPFADAAICTLLMHHLTDREAVAVIRNVGRSCRRFVIVDLVRHRLPLVLFSVFIGPMLSRVAAADGRQSIRRSCTAKEMRLLVEGALEGTGATFEQWVSPWLARQIVTITYRT